MKGTRLGGRTVLITGAGSGIGRLLALGAAERGAHLVLWDLDEDRVNAVRDEIGDKRTLAQRVDVTDPAAVAEAATKTGSVGVLVNNAGVVTGKSLIDATEASIRRTFEVNTLALYWVTKAFLPQMVERRTGHVVTVASAAGLIGVSRQTDYSASKHAAVGFDESLRAEMAAMRTGIKTLVVCPFYVDTGMFAGVQTRFPALLPLLSETTVTAKILDAIESGRRRLVMPPLVSALPLMRTLPVPAFDAVANLLGVNATMDHFTGRDGEPVASGPAEPVKVPKPLPIVGTS